MSSAGEDRKKENRKRAATLWQNTVLALLLAVGIVIAGGGASSGFLQAVFHAPCYEILVVEAASATNYVASTGLNVRAQGSTKSAKVGSFSKGDTVRVYSISDGWAEIEYNGTTAYVASKYLSKPGKVTSGKSSTGKKAASAKTSGSMSSNSASGTDDITVWLSATGDKYHSKNNCGRMNPSKARQTTRSAAKASGYEACKKCW